MVYFFMALYAEAKPIIEYYQLKQLEHQGRFKVYQDNEGNYLLVITGVGAIPAAIAVSHICTKYKVKETDQLINIGSCAGENTGEIYLCHKIESQINHSYYPDLIYHNDFLEATVKTENRVIRDIMDRHDEIKLYDMEAAGIYEAGSYFLAPHQMHFLKIVSDQGIVNERLEDGELSRRLEQIVRNKLTKICGYADTLLEISQKAEDRLFRQNKELDRKWMERVFDDLHASQTMRSVLYQHMKYYALQGFDYKEQFNNWYKEGKLPCRDKREGKKYFEQYTQQI